MQLEQRDVFGCGMMMILYRSGVGTFVVRVGMNNNMTVRQFMSMHENNVINRQHRNRGNTNSGSDLFCTVFKGRYHSPAK